MKNISLAFTGDLCPGLRLRDVMSQKGVEYPFRHVQQRLASADIAIANLEGFVLDGVDLNTRARRMGVPTELALGLRNSGINAFCVANNHLMDSGEAGFDSTLSFLEEHALGYFGAGADADTARHPLTIETQAGVVAFLGYCDFSPHWASARRPGVAGLQPERVLRQVKNVAAKGYTVVVSLHADLEFSRHPAPWRVQLSRRLVDAGARLVIQHHPHVIQGVETYGNGLIAYSLGNFVFSVLDNQYQRRWPGTDEGLILRVDLDADNDQKPPRWAVEPLRINDEHCPEPLEGDEARSVMERFYRQCAELGDPHALRRHWLQRSRREARSRLTDAYWHLRRGQPARSWSELLAPFARSENRRWVRGVIGF